MSPEHQSWPVAALLATVFLGTIAGTIGYRALAVRRGIVANPNFRSLHESPIPRGGGVVFSLVCVVTLTGLWLGGIIEPSLARTLVVGGVVATFVGFVDDVVEVRASAKLLAQCLLAAWALYAVGGRPLLDLPLTPRLVDLALSWLGLIWLMNLYNFMDGIDGMAASGAVLIGTTAIVVLSLAGGPLEIRLVFAIMAAAVAGFLLFNWPRASIFMGDAGSIFLGFYFSAMISQTIAAGMISPWTWLIVFGYFAGDTTTTTLVRMFVTDRWYREHRSHAYQNLARIWQSHLRVVSGVVLYHVLWLLPLACWSMLAPATAPLAAVLALAPVVYWALRYGPRLSST